MKIVLQDGETLEVESMSQVFEFRPDDGDELMMFCVPRLVALHREQPKLWATIEVPCEEAEALMMIERHGISMDRVLKMSAEELLHQATACSARAATSCWSTDTIGSSGYGHAGRKCGSTSAGRPTGIRR